MGHRAIAGTLIAVIVLLVASQCLTIVPQAHSGVVLRFQRVVRSGLAPGLHLKLPFLDHALYLDDGWIILDGQRENGGLEKVATSDGGPLELGYMLLWRIGDVTAFCTQNSGCDESQGSYHINQAALPLLRQAFATHSLDAALTAPLDKVLDKLVPTLNAQLKASGMEVRSVQVTRLGLTAVSQDIVYTRMRSAQSAEAAKLRAEGSAAADRIKADADQQRATILAQGQMQAQKIHGAADADAARIYARAARQDRDFFRFFLGLQAYRRAMQNGDNVIVLGPDSEFMQYLKAVSRH
ncbi:MAG TPA: SPFH domain-containing protein [Gammaproteobacteria bacterium]|nr:SPFH domain-containing protein [Gammaproteobacteria bacterium]